MSEVAPRPSPLASFVTLAAVLAYAAASVIAVATRSKTPPSPMPPVVAVPPREPDPHARSLGLREPPASKPPPREASALAMGDPYRLPRCASPVRVVATAIVDGDAAASFAILEGGEGESDLGVLRRRGDVYGGRSVAHVAFDRVFFRDGEGACQVLAYEDPPPVADRSRRESKRAQIADGLASGIREIRSDAYEVDRSVLDAMLEDAPLLGRGLAAVPVSEGGRVVGVRLVAVRAGSPLAAIGLEAGDVIQSVNGLPIATPEEALQAYARLRGAGRLAIAIRRGEAMREIEVEIR